MDADLCKGQADAAQVVKWLLQAMQQELPVQMWPVQSSIVTIIKCANPHCTGQSTHEITGNVMEVEMDQSSSTLVECLHKTFADCTVEWTCPTCVRKQLCVKETSLLEAPPVLMLRMRRAPDDLLSFQKNTSRVLYPKVDLNLSPFVMGSEDLSEHDAQALYDSMMICQQS